MVKLAKAARKQAKPVRAPTPAEEAEEEEELMEEEVLPKTGGKKKVPAKTVKNGKKMSKKESEAEGGDECAEDEVPPPPKKGKATPAKAKPAPPKIDAPVEAEDLEKEEEGDEEESTLAKPPAKAAHAEEEDEDDEGDNEEEEGDEDEGDEGQMDTSPAPVTKGKKAGMVTAKEESGDEENDEEEEEEEEESGDDEPASTPGKRGAPVKEAPPAKKAKTDNKGFCLFVGNLNKGKSFEEIKQALADFFTRNDLEVQNIRVGSSKKFGYVDFGTEEELQKALGLNKQEVLGQQVRLDKAKIKEPSQEKKKGKEERDARTLFVKNLPFSATKEDLTGIFEQAVDIRIPPGNSGSSNRGIAYVEFKTEAVADQVLQEKQGMAVQGRTMAIDFIGEKRGSKTPAAVSKTLVVTNLAYSASEATLQGMFKKAVSIRIPLTNGKPKGFAFVEFENTDDAKEALETLNNTEVEGRAIKLQYSLTPFHKTEAIVPSKTLYVKGLSQETTEEVLKDAFEGAVAARVATDKETGSSKGFGFVDFDSEESCRNAKEVMEDCEIDGKKVTLDFARPKGEGGHRGGRGSSGGGRGGFGRGGGGFRGGRGGNRGGRGGGKSRGKKTKVED